MFLACDIGNSRIKTGLFDGPVLKEIRTFKKKDELTAFINNFKKIEAAVSSVVPALTDEILHSVIKACEPYIITRTGKFNLKIDYNTPETLGIDRICSAEGALSLYMNSADAANYNEETVLLSVDFGTATTVNVIKYPKIFAGGLIAPGLGTMFTSLNKETAQLPLIDSSEFKGLIGKSTKGSIASGVINSQAGLIIKVINELKIQESAGKVIVFTTGGNARFILPHLTVDNTFDEGLVLRGIKAVYEVNTSK